MASMMVFAARKLAVSDAAVAYLAACSSEGGGGNDGEGSDGGLANGGEALQDIEVEGNGEEDKVFIKTED